MNLDLFSKSTTRPLQHSYSMKVFPIVFKWLNKFVSIDDRWVWNGFVQHAQKYLGTLLHNKTKLILLSFKKSLIRTKYNRPSVHNVLVLAKNVVARKSF